MAIDPTSILSLVATIGVAALGGERIVVEYKNRTSKNGNGGGKAPSISEIQVALQSSQVQGLSEVKQALRDQENTLIAALNRIETVNQATLHQMTKLVTIMENGYSTRGAGYRAKRK